MLFHQFHHLDNILTLKEEQRTAQRFSPFPTGHFGKEVRSPTLTHLKTAALVQFI